MNTISKKTLAALMLTAVGLSAGAPAMAQPVPPAPDATASQPEAGPEGGPMRHDGGPRRPGGPGDLLDFGRGGEAIEVALVRLSHRLTLTEEQQGLLDTLKTDALAAADDFAKATEGLRPQPSAEGATPTPPSLVDRLDARIVMEKAHVTALEAVKPAVTAFFDSLTDEQKAQLQPQGRRDDGPRSPNHKGGPRHGVGG
ncbi:hypothetical protein VW35_06685 [Devosia soli]|uniref:LTXXQ motif family protein n=1 Tax=Devosia soli TaxID=361041 RepID=A0A0F5LCP9_9HYPH|nr:Spy/CpxP family protein refolding chaperone [Devosia soli]KKB80118.1 hypothetical protein VW35_06685 [Devosia soli]